MAVKKYLDDQGLAYFAQKLDEYPDNEVLATVVNAIQEALEEKADTTVATQATNGLMSATDKTLLDTLNSNNTTFTITNDNFSTTTIPLVNAKAANLVSCSCISEAQVSEPLRTSNLLDITDTHGSAYINASGVVTPSSSGGTDLLGPFIEVTPGQDIYYTGYTRPNISANQNSNRRLHIYDSNQNWISQLAVQTAKGPNAYWSVHGVIPNNAAYVRVAWNDGDYQIQITVGQPSDYEPYWLTPFIPITSATFYVSTDGTQANTDDYTINVPQIAGAVYGFEWNPIAGKLWVTTGHIASYNNETLPDYWWSNKENYNPLLSPSLGAEVVYVLDEEDYIEYDITPINITLNHGDNIIWIDNGVIKSVTYLVETVAFTHVTIQDKMRLRNTDIQESDVTAWNETVTLANTLSSTKADLESPAFTGTPTASQPGNTNYSTRIATTQFVQEKMNNLAHNEKNTTASQNYTVGQYICVRGTFYKVIDNISKDAAFVENTNIEATTVGEQLQLLMTAVFS